MILEHAVLNVVTGRECEFEQAFAEAQLIISSMAGYQSHALMKCHELGNRYLLLVQWASLEDHTIGFRNSPEYEQWKKKLHDFYEPFPEVHHYSTVESASSPMGF